MKTAFSLNLFIVVIVSGCQNDKECVPPPLAKQIVNHWEAKLVSDQKNSQELAFEANGTLKESKGLIFGASSKPVCSWEVDHDSVILSAKFVNGSIEQYECAVISRTCDQIVLDIEGIEQLELNKK